MKVSDNLVHIQKRIDKVCNKIGRNSNEVKIIAVTKYVSIERAAEAIEAGINHLGENRDDGLVSKYETLGNKSVWHFIGSLQTRKVKNIIDIADYIHSLDRISLADEIQKRASQIMKCLIQVNVVGEESKHGLSPEEALMFVQALREKNYDKIEIAGLMTMAPYTDDVSLIRKCFKGLKDLQQQIQEMDIPSMPCTELSMGMSNDYEIAIEEGATMIRIGTALVGNES
ncbi:YggS family pyridoxal phosphate-dependent enzyme [Peribacillus alkalitolerans]|uniref:YggS family pyridoxal phosphate-dependent enzyme n=1 Tax=Peribacillus alkalitolerans TaxID=1550385 RepID=UPI0013D1C402|nr:YggS family pyridoxal phosphate-dependent enzyme [Peribacillus alkalitolerans]